MWTNKEFWLATLERATKTAAQALLVLLGGGTGLSGVVSWQTALMGVLWLTLASVLTSIVSYDIGPTGSPSTVVDRQGGRHSSS